MVEAKTDTATDELLQMDDAVDELSPIQVKDVWSRGAFMKAIIDAHGPSYMRSEECDEIEQMLSDFNPDGLKRTAIHALGRDHPVTQSLGWEKGRGNVETLFDRFTKDGIPEDELVEKARENLKSGLRGTGMPRINVYRERVKAHANGDTDL